MKIQSTFLNGPWKQEANNLKDSYAQFLREIREDIEEGHDSEFLSSDFQEEFREIIFNNSLNDFNFLKFFWLNLVDRLIDTLSIFEDPIEDSADLISFFSNSEYLGFILDELESGKHPDDVIESIIDAQEVQIICFYYLHISKSSWEPNGPVNYQAQFELGDFKQGIHLGEELYFYEVPSVFDIAALPVVSFDPIERELSLSDGDHYFKIKGNPPTKVQANGVFLLKNYSNDESRFEKEKNKFVEANHIISSVTPELKTFLSTFSNFIVPTEQAEIVSYSMAQLPGVSVINMINRDLVDLVDDLIHENGHHYLNSLLEGEEELIFEDDEKIYYSPWRKALRPVRGIYHATLTFYWAYYLFKSLSISERSSEFFNAEELEKIRFRFIEEKEMISCCLEEVRKAYSDERISDTGFSLIVKIEEELKRDSEIADNISNKLSSKNKSEINELIETLKKRKDLESKS